MSKQAGKKRVAENEAMARVTSIRVSPRKIALVAAMIRNMKVDQALTQLTFSQKRIAQDVKKCLISAIANAENNHGLDADRLFISRAETGKALVMKRIRARARGRAGSIKKFFSNLTIVVREGEDK